MRVTKEQVERLAKSRIEYDAAFDEAVLGEEPRRSHLQAVLSYESLKALADAAGQRVAKRIGSKYVTWAFELGGVEFFHIEELEGGDA